jgi:hypothetical protein
MLAAAGAFSLSAGGTMALNMKRRDFFGAFAALPFVAVGAAKLSKKLMAHQPDDVLVHTVWRKCPECRDTGWVSRACTREEGVSYREKMEGLGVTCYGQFRLVRCPRGCEAGIEKILRAGNQRGKVWIDEP